MTVGTSPSGLPGAEPGGPGSPGGPGGAPQGMGAEAEGKGLGALSPNGTLAGAMVVPATARPALVAAAPFLTGRRRWEFLYFAVRNKKLVLGLSIELVFILAAIFGPALAPYSAAKFVAPANLHPSLKHLLGTTYFGEDVFSQMLYALRDSYLVGFLGALCAAVVGLTIGFTAGWLGGLVDDVLQMFTNIVVMIPALVLLIVIGAYLKQHSAFFEGFFIGVTTWPWVARAVRAQTFTLRSRDFVDLARLSGKRGRQHRAEGHRPQYGVVPVPGVRPIVRELDAHRGELRFPGAGADQLHLVRRHDVQLPAVERPGAARVVVVHTAGGGDDGDGCRPADRQRRP